MFGPHEDSRGGDLFPSIQSWWDLSGVLCPFLDLKQRMTWTYWSEFSEGTQTAVDHPCARKTFLKGNPNESVETEGKLEILRRLVKKECRYFEKRTTLMDYGQIWHLSSVWTESVPMQMQDKNATFIFNKDSYIDALYSTALICTKRSPETEHN